MYVRENRVPPLTRLFLYAPLLFAIVALVACGSGSDDTEVETIGPTTTPAGTPTANEQAYLDEVSASAALIEEQFAKFGEVFGGLYETRSALLFALEQAGAGTAFDSALAAMEALEPPEGFRAEHELALDGLRDLQRVDREVGLAVEGEDP